MRGTILGVLTVLLFAHPGSADIVATWQLNDGATTVLSVRDDQHVRIDTNEKDTYMLVQDQKVYMVRKEDDQWTAFDMDQMAGMMKMFQQNNKQISEKGLQGEFRDTGRHETIAGYKGKVFDVEYTDQNGKKKTEEIVLSRHEDIERIHKGWVVFASRMAQMLGQDSARMLDQSLKSAKMKGYGGMLRYGKDMTLQRVEKPNHDIAYYRLPPGVAMLNMPGMGGAIAEPTQPAARKEAAGSSVEKKTENTANDSSQPSVVEGVRQGVKSIFKKVW